MTFLHYQLVIFVSVLCLTRIHRKLGIVAALVWTLWSLATLQWPGYIAIQIFTAWASWYGTWCFLKQKGHAGNASKTGKEAPYRTRRTTTKNHLVQERDHDAERTHALKTAKKELMIVSGWLSDRVINDQFCGLLESALERGVNVHIAYGASDRDGQHRLSDTAIKALKRLKETGDHSRKGRLTIVQRPTHEKCLVVDNRYAIVGSFNWLANAHYRDRETSLKVHQRRVVGELMASCKGGYTRSMEMYGRG
ncbi:phospholipase D-like domain-containing protein [Kushneria phyllosphaerae]|uniref:Cardiolipin synthase B n=1 Tax=Kushneria phyllosphaerae TaxID=2100822 RepID=A0A2R8CIY8_9GAMM|nr:phospholipase D-like domain-containing protein [Kushneria phyllosphaerae]SPJ32855.1 Cardiolipin synthase B [Kushneria phyllosphaerae]